MANESSDVALERERFRALFKESPESAKLWEEYGKFLHNETDDARAEAFVWRNVASFYPERHFGLRLGDALARSGNLREGLVQMYQFLQDNPTAFAYRIIARHLIGIRKLRRARKLLRKAILVDPENAETTFLLGESLPAELNTQNISYFRKAVEANPSLTEAWYNLGTALILDPRSRNEGVRALEKALELAPNDFFVHIQLGFGYGMLDELEHAAHHFRRATESDPSNETAMRYYNRYLQLLCQRAVDGGPQIPDATD